MRVLVRRLVQMVVILAGLSFLLFGLLSAMPGDPVDLLITSNPSVKPEDVVRLKKLRGLDKPWTVRYLRWLWGHHAPLPTPRVTRISPSVVEQGAAGVTAAVVDLAAPLAAAGFGEGWRLVPLFDATAEGTTLQAELDGTGQHRLWAVVENPHGLKTIVHADVWVAPAVPPDAPPRDDKALWDAARAAPRRPLVKVLEPRVADGPKSYVLEEDPAVYRERPPPGQAAATAMDPPTPEALRLLPTHSAEEGPQFVVERREAGQEVIEVQLGAARGAFLFEHGPVPDPDRFERGVLFALAGDQEALGFSNTYKRPVWEILFGPAVVCGDGFRGAGEACDDGNQTSGDGCSARCYDESQGAWATLDVAASGVLLGSGRVFNTLSLMLPALLLSLFIAIPIGVLAAVRQYSWLDYVVNFLAFIGVSMPVFWLGIMLMAVFAERLHWLPAGGIQTPGMDGSFLEVLADRLRYTVMPAAVLSVAYTGRWLRYMRASMLEVLPLDFVRTARAKGLAERVVVLKHALRNALIPVVTVLALSLPSLFSGAVLTEWVFSWPGIGRLQFDAVMSNDSYVAIVVFLVSAALVMTGNLIADVLYVIIDPRLRRTGR